MDKKAKLIKGLVKKNVSDKSTFGTDPRDPWSAKAGINEDRWLNMFLNSRGINPKFVSKDTKVSHSKSSEFIKWKQDHQVESTSSVAPDQDSNIENLEEISMQKLTQYKTAAGKSASQFDASGQFKKANKRFSGIIKATKKQFAKTMKTEQVDKKDTVVVDIPFLIRILELAREDIKTDMDLHRVVEKLIQIRNKGILTMDDYDFIANIKEDIDLGFDFKLKETSCGCPKACDCLDKMKLNLKKKAEYNSEKLRRKQLALGEDIYQDPLAATQTVFDGANNTDDTSVSLVKRQLSKSARMIKALYKSKGMKEELNDWEKEDKSVVSPGKKPSIQNMKKQLGVGIQPKAAAVMTGGKTLTGTPRDTIEIDPVMKQRPGSNPDKMNQQNQQKV